MGCNECTHPSCQHSLSSLGIGQCVECEGGVLVLDLTSGPKWKMACNKCNVVVHFFEHAHRVQVRALKVTWNPPQLDPVQVLGVLYELVQQLDLLTNLTNHRTGSVG